MLNKFDNRFGLTSLSKRGEGKRRERGNGSSWTASDKSTIPKESLSVWRKYIGGKKKKKGGGGGGGKIAALTIGATV